MISKWQTSVDHADTADWVTVAAYLLAALLAARAAGHAGLEAQGRESVFWRITAVLLVFLGVNELLDLQTLLTVIGREHAMANGWYGEHRRVQYIFVLALGILAVLTGVATLWLTRPMHAAVGLAVAGLVFIGAFVLSRAASFHHLNDVLGSGTPEFNWGSVQEMAGIVVVAAAAALYTRKRSKQR